MFFHNYKYRLKCIVRDRSMMFWILLFPIILAVLFNLALGNIGSADNFEPINIAVIKNSSYEGEKEFIKVLDEISDDKNDDVMFNTKYVSESKAKDLLKNNKIEGYIFFDDDINMVVNQSGLNQTIIKSFIDEYKEKVSTVTTILSENPKDAHEDLMKNLLKDTNYLKEVSVSKQAPDFSVNYFYTLIGMACLYGSFLGVKEINAIQANQSSQGARVCISPTHKLKVFASSMLATTTVQLFNMVVLLLFISFVLQVDFSNNLGYVLLTCFMGSVTGVSMGTFVGIIMKKNEGAKMGVLVVTTMSMSFLAGMMYDKMKYIIDDKVPLLGYINPVNLIADSFYSLYFYDTPTKFFMNMAMLLILSVIFSAFTYFILRGQRYASL